MDEKKLDKSIIRKLKKYPKSLDIFKKLMNDEEALSYLEVGNSISIKRLGYNDHGRIHTKIATDSSLKLYELLGKKPNLVKEKMGTEQDSITAIVMGAFLHDIGMSINREDHEKLGITIAKPIMERILGDHKNKHKIIATACEAILCHMANYKPTSLEAGIVSVADGTDMTAGRARIPYFYYELGGGKIHGLSALSILNVDIKKAKKKKARIEVLMKNPAGIFQVEEVLLPKLLNSGLADDIEVFAVVREEGKKPEKIQIN